MARFEIGHHEGWLCIVYFDNEWSNPVRVKQWWPVCQMSEQEMKDRGFDIGKPVESRSSGSGMFYFKRTIGHGWQELQLKDGGKTLPIHTERNDIPKPKTRVETRYQDGHWEKYLKAQGWVVA